MKNFKYIAVTSQERLPGIGLTAENHQIILGIKGLFIQTTGQNSTAGKQERKSNIFKILHIIQSFKLLV